MFDSITGNNANSSSHVHSNISIYCPINKMLDSNVGIDVNSSAEINSNFRIDVGSSAKGNSDFRIDTPTPKSIKINIWI